MIKRRLTSSILNALNSMPVVALLGARQVGKTTLTLEIAKTIHKPSVYLDLETDLDLAKLHDAEHYLTRCSNKLLIIDEVQRKPDLFRALRSHVDSRIRDGERTGQFLILGSASRDLLRQSAESLAGRIRYLELIPFTILEIHDSNSDDFDVRNLWLRGGFPGSYLAASDNESWKWREDFISTYIERDIPSMIDRAPSNTIRRLWSMLAWENAQQINYSRLGSSLGVSYHTARSYLDILTSAFVVRELQPWFGNTKKRLVKSPKVYLRDAGLTHRLLRIGNYDDLLGHPAVGASWEAFVIENIIRELPDTWDYSYYRTSAQAEIDLVLEGPGGIVRAVEIKFSSVPRLSRGFYSACQDVGANEKFVIYFGEERFSLGNDIEAIGVLDFLRLIATDSKVAK